MTKAKKQTPRTIEHALNKSSVKHNPYSVVDDKAYALEITGDSMLPVYREGDVLIVSPAAVLRKGDRVVVKTTQGKVTAKVMQKKTAKAVELASFSSPRKAIKIAMKDVDWMARIIWASQ